MTEPYNKASHQARRQDVPASRAIVGVSPCRSTQSSTGVAERT